MLYLDPMTKEDLGVDDSLLESAAKSRLERLAKKANEGQLAAEEAREYDRFIELGDIIATLGLKAERQLQFARG